MFRSSGVDNPEVDWLSDEIAKMEAEAQVKTKAEEEAARKAADDQAAAAAAAFKAEAELAEKKAKEQVAARQVVLCALCSAICAPSTALRVRLSWMLLFLACRLTAARCRRLKRRLKPKQLRPPPLR
jgi:hypothetical protein